MRAKKRKEIKYTKIKIYLHPKKPGYYKRKEKTGYIYQHQRHKTPINKRNKIQTRAIYFPNPTPNSNTTPIYGPKARS
jgi:hypothetical protein